LALIKAEGEVQMKAAMQQHEHFLSSFLLRFMDEAYGVRILNF